MNRIETIKAAVSPADAAERYGLKVSRNGAFCGTQRPLVRWSSGRCAV